MVSLVSSNKHDGSTTYNFQKVKHSVSRERCREPYSKKENVDTGNKKLRSPLKHLRIVAELS